MATKQVYKIGEMIVDQKQIFWKMQHCYALIPIVQLFKERTFFFTQMSYSRQIDQWNHTITSSPYRFSTYP